MSADDELCLDSTSQTISPDERKRLTTIQALGLPSTAKGSGVLQAICDTAAKFMKTEMAVISIIGAEYVFFVATYGTPETKVHRKYSLASWIIDNQRFQVFVAEDIHADARFATFPWVKQYGLSYYASAPLVASNGQCIGLLSAGDRKSEKRPAEDYNAFCSFAELATREMESGHYTTLERLLQRRIPMLRELEDVEEAVFLCEVTSRWWTILFANRKAQKLTSLLQIPEPHFWGIFQPVDGTKNWAQKLACAEIEQGNNFTLQVKLRERCRVEKELTIQFRSTNGSPLSTQTTAIGVPNEVATAQQMSRKLKHTHYFAVLRPGPKREAPKMLGAPQTFLSREFRSNSGSARNGGTADASKGMSDVKLGIICSSSSTARIYRALWNRQIVSVKVVTCTWDKCVQSKEYGSAMIPKQAALSAELIHPNVIRTFKIVVQPKIADHSCAGFRKGDEIVEACIVREWCGSGDLQAITQKGVLHSPDQAANLQLLLGIAANIAAGMEYLHVHNIIHGGLHPTSILMGDDLQQREMDPKDHTAKIASLSRAEVSAKPIQTETRPPDLDYAAPELATKGIMSKASDVFAFGKLLCYMHNNGSSAHPMTQESRPWWKANREACVLPAGMPPGLEALVKDCIASKPSQRPDFAVIKERLANLTAAAGTEGDLASEEGMDTVSELSESSFRRNKHLGPKPRRSSIDQAKAAMDNLVRCSLARPLSSSLSRVRSKKEREVPKEPQQDFTELLAVGSAAKPQSAAMDMSPHNTTSVFGRKIRGLISYHGKAVS